MPRQDRFPRYVAVHEAGHAVASWYFGVFFECIALRTPAECAEGPYVTNRGNLREVQGVLEGPPIYDVAVHAHLRGLFHQAVSVLGEESGPRVDLVPAASPPHGVAHLAGVTGEALTDLELELEWQEFVMQVDLIRDLAGPVAEARYRRVGIDRVFEAGGDDDNERVRAVLAEHVGAHPFRIAAHRHLLIERTREIFRESGVWDATLAVADALCQRRRLWVNEVASIIEGVTALGDRDMLAMAPGDLGERYAERLGRGSRARSGAASPAPQV